MAPYDAAALFDVDGTLVDTAYVHTLTWWQALRQYGHHVEAARVHRAIGMGADQLLPHLLGDDRDPAEDEAIDAAHLALYAEHWPTLRALPGAADLLRECAARGWRVVLATSASERELSVLREALGADDAVAAATTADDVSASKPAPDLVRCAVDRAGVPAERAVFIGDSVWDVRAARRASVPCLAVESGGFADGELRAAGALEVHPDVLELLRHLDDSVLARPRAGGPAHR